MVKDCSSHERSVANRALRMFANIARPVSCGTNYVRCSGDGCQHVVVNHASPAKSRQCKSNGLALRRSAKLTEQRRIYVHSIVASWVARLLAAFTTAILWIPLQ